MASGSTGLHTVATCDTVQHVNAEPLSKPTLFIFNIGFCFRNCVDRPLRTGKKEVLVNRACEHGLSMRMFARAWGMLTTSFDDSLGPYAIEARLEEARDKRRREGEA